jgi:DNA polymerase-1
MKLLSAAAIRRCLIADPGMAIFTADFDQIELRVVAALANETAMIDAAKRGESLHLTAANRLFGIDHTPDQYKLGKNINFTFVFAGGADTMAKRYSITVAQAMKLIKDYEEAFPSLAAYKRRETNAIIQSALSPVEHRTFKALRSRMYNFRGDTPEGRKARKAIQLEIKRLCRGKVGWITTAFGRRIPVDAEKPYTVINYKVQTTARDIMGEALLDVMRDPELEPTVLLPIHDEILGQGPIAKAEYLAQRYAEVMTREFMGVPITASGQVYGKSWGHGYRKDK